MSSRPRFLLGSGSTEVYPGAGRRLVPTLSAGRAAKLSKGILALGAIINTYDILDRYARLGQLTRQQAGYELLTNAGFTVASYGIGEAAAGIVTYYTAAGTPATPVVIAVGTGLAFLTFDLMVTQNTVNNMIEGQSFWQSVGNARNSTLDSLGGIIGKDHEDWDNRLRSWGIY